jgi:hypothetical protein
VARDEARGMVHEQQRKHSANGRQTPEPKDPQP